MPKRISTLISLIFFVAALVIAPPPARAKGVSILRDVEIENTLRAMSTPLFEAAGLSPSSVRILLVNDDSLNAFVAGGQNLFIHAGLLMAAEDASEVIGVIAHETGHISGGHLARVQDSLDKNMTAGLLSALLGIGAGIATGRGDVGAAVAAGGQSMATRNFLSHTRAEEGAADQAALKYLERTGYSAQGLRDFMKKLEGQELLISSNSNPYVRTHPLTRERIDAIEAHIARTENTGGGVDPEIAERFQRLQAKLYGYLNPPVRTLRQYKPGDDSIPARYARAFAYLQKPDVAKALDLADSLLADRPDDPFFHELRGQILFEAGRGREAIGNYRRAVEALPEEPLLRYELARVLIETGDAPNLEDAIGHLKIAVDREPRFASAWHYLGIAYGRLDRMGHSALALGEEALLTGRPKDAEYHARKAEKEFERGSREWLHAQDILTAIESRRDQAGQ